VTDVIDAPPAVKPINHWISGAPYAGVSGRTLIVNLPGSPKGALESIEAIVPILDHALETLAGPFDHGAGPAGDGDASASADGDAPGDSTEDQHDFGRDVPVVEPEKED